jgi:hypothetical protein
MAEKILKLWTRQSVDFDITRDVPDNKKSQSPEHVTKFFDPLFRRLKTSAFIWCTDHQLDAPLFTNEIEYALIVPESFRIGSIDEVQWARLRGVNCEFRPSQQMEFREQAKKLVPEAGKKQDAAYEKICQEFMRVKPGEDLWEKTILREHVAECAVLIRSPIEVRWIKSTRQGTAEGSLDAQKQTAEHSKRKEPAGGWHSFNRK